MQNTSPFIRIVKTSIEEEEEEEKKPKIFFK